MKGKDQHRLEVLRFFLAQIKNKEIELRPSGEQLTDEHVFKVLKKLLKQNAETIEMCQTSGRQGQLNEAEKEKAVLNEFMAMMPEELLKQEEARMEKARQYMNRQK